MKLAESALLPYVIAAGLIGAALLYVSARGAGKTGQQLGGAAVDLVGGVLTGAAEKAGVPQADADRCAAAQAAGDTWAASFACPAGEFIGWWWNK